MGRKLLLILALGAFGAIVAAGAAVASGGLLDTSKTGVSVNLPGGQNLPPVNALPACSNTKDDDGDGLVDMADPGCSSPLDSDESNPTGTTGGGSTGTTGVTGPSGVTGPTGTTGTTGTTGATGTTGSGGSAGPGGGTGGTRNGGGAGHNGHGHHHGTGGTSAHNNPKPPPPVKSNGVPTRSNPTLSIASPSPAPLGVPTFLISQFEIPPFLLPIYQACGTQYGIPWEVLAGINKIETGFGTNLNVSTSGAVGWMQFMPSTWRAYGVDANGDGRADPYNPVDAICAAARYLKASGGETDLRRAIFSYNHASWYVDEVLLYARQYGRLPADLVGSLTGLTQGDQFPVAAKARYADSISTAQAASDAKPTKGPTGNAANVVSGSSTRRAINIFSREGAPVVAVNDGAVQKVGHNSKLGNYVILEDEYGNRFTYSQLGQVAKTYPVPRATRLSASDFKFVGSGSGHSARDKAGAKSTRSSKPQSSGKASKSTSADPSSIGSGSSAPQNTENTRRRLYALPDRPHNAQNAGISGEIGQLMAKRFPGYSAVKSYFGGVLHMNRHAMVPRRLRKGSKVTAGTVLGRIGQSGKLAPHVTFAIQPAGKGSPYIDPKPILDGWQLLRETAIYRAAGKNPLIDSASSSTGTSSIAQDLLLPKSALAHRVLADPRLSIYSCGRNDIATGQIDRRVLATMEYLADSGFRLGVSSLRCGAPKPSSPGAVSAAGSGNAMSISEINGAPVRNHQGPGSLANEVIQKMLDLQGTMQPQEVISTEDLPGQISIAKPKPANQIQVRFSELSGGYVNPFPDSVLGRTDMGVDFTGSGPILAIGTARILQVGAPGWPNGGAGPAEQGVLYRLLSGPEAGSIIYVYEGLTPMVKPGDLVLPGERIATFYPGSSIEIGFADAAGAPLAHDNYTEGKVTGWGKRMFKFLNTLGVPSSQKLDHQFSSLLKPGQWSKVINRLNHISNPSVQTEPSPAAIPAGKSSTKRSGNR